ncbi:hypothetical protein C1J02_13910 [Sulfitobacter sp. SK011]|nr:hypothetical protein C1J02_13910 [Sulfitobacter sp. SK011]
MADFGSISCLPKGNFRRRAKIAVRKGWRCHRFGGVGKKGDDIREEEDVAAKTRFAREEDERLCSFYRISLATDP